MILGMFIFDLFNLTGLGWGGLMALMDFRITKNEWTYNHEFII